METNIEEISQVKRQINVEIETEEVTKKLDQAYNELSKRAKVKGFRPGKTPRRILEQYYIRNSRDLSREIYIEWDDDAFEIKIKELYLILEKFYYTMYLLSVKIANYYNLEFKLKKGKEDTQNFL